jgi:hypothetical protein
MSDQISDFEKRNHKRMGLKFQVELETLPDGRMLQLISRDISAGGLGISKLAPEGMEVFTEEELQPSTKVDIRLILPGCQEEIELTGTIKWSQRSKTGIWKTGIEFDEPQARIKPDYIKEEGEKRRIKRYDRLFQIELRRLKEKQSYIALCANLSNFGMQAFSDVLFSSDTPVEIKMKILGREKKVATKGIVQWARQVGEDTWRIGIKFDEPFSLDKIRIISQ